jgi:hypothetical protein
MAWVCGQCETRPLYAVNGNYCFQCRAAQAALQRYWKGKGQPLAWDRGTNHRRQWLHSVWMPNRKVA